MPRKPRYYLAGVPCHVVQRGHNREPCFMRTADFSYYKQSLIEACVRYEADVHAYVLMTNHVHLLVSPGRPDSISRVLQSVGRRYVRYVNVAYGRSGTLWEGRHKASLIDSERYLMACYRYIEMNPVRAGMVRHPQDYPWSSYRAHANGIADALVREHDGYRLLGQTPSQRQQAYGALFRAQPDDREGMMSLRQGTKLCVPVGSERFKSDVERRLGCRISYQPRGRPRKTGQTGSQGVQLKLPEG